jgi:hypothetical protein
MACDVNWHEAICGLLDAVYLILDAESAFVELGEGPVEAFVDPQILIGVFGMNEADAKVGVPIRDRGCAPEGERNEIFPSAT